MTTEEKFHAAVNVIRSLPKNGSYQPSNELMLRFYAYFKQAMQGPCKGSRPPFWDVVGRAKYDAYKALGNMSKQEAMKSYVDELHRIVETMSYSDNVASFLEAPPSELDSVSISDLQLVVGDVMQRVRSQPSSPVGSREASPTRIHSSLGSTPSTSTVDDSDHSDEEYIDSVEIPEPRKNIPNGVIHSELSNGYAYKDHVSRVRSKKVDISQEISQTVLSLRLDIDRLSKRIERLENSTGTKIVPKRFLFGTTPELLAFIIVWPFIASFILRRFLYRK